MIEAIQVYLYQCANGNQTVGSCSHVAAIIYYLSFTKFQAKIIRLMEYLTELFDENYLSEEVVIAECIFACFSRVIKSHPIKKKLFVTFLDFSELFLFFSKEN